MQVLDAAGNPIALDSDALRANPRDLHHCIGHDGDQRRLENLFDPNICDEAKMWLTTFNGDGHGNNGTNTLEIDLGKVCTSVHISICFE